MTTRADAAGQLVRLLGFARPYRLVIAGALLATVLSTGFGLAFPYLVGQTVDIAFGRAADGGPAALDRTAALMLLVLAAQAALNGLRGYLMAVAGSSVIADVRETLHAHVLTLPVRFFEERAVGEITSRLGTDVSVLGDATSESLAQALGNSFIVIGGITIMLLTDARLSLLMLAVVPVVGLAGQRVGRLLNRAGSEQQDRLADANAAAEEAIGGMRVVKSFTAEPHETHRYAQLVRKAQRVRLARARLWATFTPAVRLATLGGIAAVLWYGGRLVLAGELGAGELVRFLLYTNFVGTSISALTSLYGQYQEALGATRRVFQLLDEPSERAHEPSPRRLARIEGRVTLEGVSFRYGDRGDHDILNDISIEARPGETIALVGPSGAGKSTLAALISRFHDPTAGRILLDGLDLRAIDLRDLRSHVGVVAQETQLFSGTVADNIRYGRPNATDNDIEAAARAANAHAFVMAFPAGYATVVGERGVKLSGGQRQRISIARAVLKDPRVLVLDEATSALDREAETLVQEALERLMHGRTTFVIAHRLATVRNADRIVVLEAGRVIEEGPPAELLARPNGRFATMANTDQLTPLEPA